MKWFANPRNVTIIQCCRFQQYVRYETPLGTYITLNQLKLNLVSTLLEHFHCGRDYQTKKRIHTNIIQQGWLVTVERKSHKWGNLVTFILAELSMFNNWLFVDLNLKLQTVRRCCEFGGRKICEHSILIKQVYEVHSHVILSMVWSISLSNCCLWDETLCKQVITIVDLQQPTFTSNGYPSKEFMTC